MDNKDYFSFSQANDDYSYENVVCYTQAEGETL